MTRAMTFGAFLAVPAVVWSCASDGGNSDAAVGITNTSTDAGPTGQPPLPGNETEGDAALSPVESSTRGAASPGRPEPSVDAGCHMIVVHASRRWGGGSIAVPLCEEDVGCDTGDDLTVLAIDPEGTCWILPNPCVPVIWVAQGWEEVVDCPEPSSSEAGTDASGPETADAGNTSALDGAASPLDAAPVDASVDAAP
jgi:hypothetical protein